MKGMILLLTFLIKDSGLAGIDIPDSALLVQSIELQLIIVAGSIRQGLGVLSGLLELFLHTKTRNAVSSRNAQASCRRSYML